MSLLAHLGELCCHDTTTHFQAGNIDESEWQMEDPVRPMLLVLVVVIVVVRRADEGAAALIVGTLGFPHLLRYLLSPASYHLHDDDND